MLHVIDDKCDSCLFETRHSVGKDLVMATVIGSRLVSSRTALSFRNISDVVLADVNVAFDVSVMRVDAVEASATHLVDKIVL